MARNSLSVTDALQEAGKKLTRSELRGFMDRGLSRDDASSLLDRHSNVGDKARTFYDSGSGGSGGGEEREKMRTLKLTGSPGQKLFLTDDGSRVAIKDDMEKYVGREGFSNQHSGWFDGRNLLANNKSGNKLNDWLDEKGYSLSGGKGWEQVGTRKVTVDSGDAWTNISGSGMMGGRPYNDSVHVGQHKEWVPIYGRVEKAVKPEKPEAEPREHSGESAPQSFGGSDEANKMIREGTFDVPARPTYGESFLQDYMGSAGDAEISDPGPDPNAPIMQPRTPTSPLRDGYPSPNDWTPTPEDKNWGWNWEITAGGAPGDNEELNRSFAASAAFRDRLNSIVMS